MSTQRKRYSAEFKARVALETLKGHKTVKYLAPSGRTLLISDMPDASPTASSHPQVCQR
jgi:hypothetical protein